MKISITAEKTIAEFQEDLMALFPSLKIEFFTKAYELGTTLGSEDMVYNRIKIMGEISKNHIIKQSENLFDFTPDTTVRAFQEALWQQYGLSVQLFRNSLGTFVETTSTDTWTLAEQEHKGSESGSVESAVLYMKQ